MELVVSQGLDKQNLNSHKMQRGYPNGKTTRLQRKPSDRNRVNVIWVRCWASSLAEARRRKSSKYTMIQYPCFIRRGLQVSEVWWRFGVLNLAQKEDPERCSVCCPRWNGETFERICACEQKNKQILDRCLSCTSEKGFQTMKVFHPEVWVANKSV